MSLIVDFRVDIPRHDIEDLNARLRVARWPHELADVGWEYGIPTGYVRRIAEYWRETFDWRESEGRMNAYSHFLAEIDGERMHFTHVRSPEPDALPLVLVHGWPFEDFTQMIGPLTDPATHGGDPRDAFHVVVPSLPGFGFSGPTRRPGAASTGHAAEMVAQLMERLGYSRYGAQGGDAGSYVCPQLGRIAPERVVGVHLNDPITIPSAADASDPPPEWNDDGSLAYAAIHSTRPQTLAPAVSDSPVGLLAWVLDIINTYTDPAKDLPHDAIELDVLLANISILWFTNTIGSSMRIYRESAEWVVRQPKSGVPTGIALFPGSGTVRGIVEQENSVTRWSEFARGGHFAAMEAPDLLAADVAAFFRGLR